MIKILSAKNSFKLKIYLKSDTIDSSFRSLKMVTHEKAHTKKDREILIKAKHKHSDFNPEFSFDFSSNQNKTINDHFESAMGRGLFDANNVSVLIFCTRNSAVRVRQEYLWSKGLVRATARVGTRATLWARARARGWG